MTNLIHPQFMQVARAIAKENNKTLKLLFKDKINGSFLIKIKNEVLTGLGTEFCRIFSLNFDNTRVVTGDSETPEYDICRMIIGVHRHYSVFLTKEEIQMNQNDAEYQKKLVVEVIEKVRLHQFCNLFFRKKQLILGDEFLYFPVPYELFALCMRFNYILLENHSPILVYYVDIINNALSALTLMENNLLSNAYPSCRSLIEQYLKVLILQRHPECVGTYAKFCNFEIEQSCCSQEYPDEFLCLYSNRVLPSVKNKIDFLHYGWLDDIPTYTTITNRYSIYGILEYLQKNANEELCNALSQLKTLYKGCHGYTHGSSVHVKYPLLQYFEISTMLYYIVKDTFLYLHKELKIEMLYSDKTLIECLERDFKKLYTQYKIRTAKNFELYYNNL